MENEKKSTGHPKTILLVDDQDDYRITTKLFLSNFGYVVDSARCAEQALALFDATVHDIVITDNRMPGMSGSEMAQVIKQRSTSTPIIMYSGLPPENRSALDVFIVRPTHLLTLKEAVDKMFEVSQEGRDPANL